MESTLMNLNRSDTSMINPQMRLTSLTTARLNALCTCLAIWLCFCGVARSQTTAVSRDTQSSGNKTAKLYTKSYALVIGVNEPLGEWSPLKSAEQDAQIFADHLKQRGFDVTLLIGKEANKKEILKQLQTQLPQNKLKLNINKAFNKSLSNDSI